MTKTLVLMVLLISPLVPLLSQSDSSSDASRAGAFVIPLFDSDVEEDGTASGQQEISPLLRSSNDVFTQFASFQFGAARYRMRGLPGNLQQVYMNGLLLQNPETGNAGWSDWGGLNEVTRTTEARFGEFENPYGSSTAGGYSYIDSRASAFRKGTKASYALANRNYRNRFLLVHSTGLMKNNFAISFSASYRTGTNVFYPGTYFTASAFYISVDKKFSDKHLLSFTSFVAPTEQARRSAVTEETYRLARATSYNPAWGLQGEKQRSASVSRNLRPHFILNDELQLENKWMLTSAALFSFGKSGRTALNWQDADNPKPDYYKNLPSYYLSNGDTATALTLEQDWQNEPRQLDWNRMIELNQANLYTDPHLLGQGINTTETRARYIVENQIEKQNFLQLNSVLKKNWKKSTVRVGVNAHKFSSRKYKEIEDLLGASYYLDIDQFAEELGVEEHYQQNDLDNPNKKAREGDQFGYDYSIRIFKAECWSQFNFNTNRTDYYIAGAANYRTLSREGHVANGKFPLTSKGKSETIKLPGGNFKAGLVHKFSGRHYLTANGLFQKGTNDLSSYFISPKVRRDLTSGTGNELLYSVDLSYRIRYPSFNLRITAYHTQQENYTQVRTYWHDEYNTMVNLIVKDLDQRYEGLEFGAEKNFSGVHYVQGALGLGEFRYSNRPTLEAWKDNDHTAIYDDRTSYLTNYKLGVGPQLVAGVGYKISSSKMWFAGVYGNYFDQIYLEPNPDRRTAEAIAKYREDDHEQISQITDQERLPGYFLVNLNAGKSFRIRKKYFALVNLSVNNLLNEKNALTNGFESLRWDQNNVELFGPKYTFMQGTTYMLIMNLNF